MKKVATFFTMATILVALSSCGSKTAETTEASADSLAAQTMEAAPAEAVDTASAMMADTTAH